MFIYCWNKNKYKHLINPEHCYANKIELFDSNYKSQQKNSTKIFSKFIIFLLFYFDFQLNRPCKFFWSSTKIDGKSYRVSMKTFFSLRLKLTKKVTAFHCFQTAPPKKNFFVPSPHKHTTLAPGRPLTIRYGLNQRKSLFWCLTVSWHFLSSLFAYLIDLVSV